MDSLHGSLQTALWLIGIGLTGAAGFWLIRVALPRVTGNGRLNRLRQHLHRSQKLLRCKESIRLTPQHTLHLVEWENRRFVVACHPGGTVVLPEAAAEPELRTTAAAALGAAAAERRSGL